MPLYTTIRDIIYLLLVLVISPAKSAKTNDYVAGEDEGDKLKDTIISEIKSERDHHRQERKDLENVSTDKIPSIYCTF